MAKITPGPTWFVRTDERGRAPAGPPRLPLPPGSRRDLVLALAERSKADPRVLFEQGLGWRRWWVYLRFGEVAGRIECIGMEVMGDPDLSEQAPVTALALRGLPLGRLVDRARREYREGLAATSGLAPEAGSWSADVPAAEREEIAARVRVDLRDRLALAERDAAVNRKGRPKLYGPEHFAQVAEVYVAAWRAGGNPTAEVAHRFGVTVSAAAKWVARARSMGLLPPTSKGRASGLLVATRKGSRGLRGGKKARSEPRAR